MGVDSKVFAGRDVPKGAGSWSLFDANGKRCMAPGSEGVEIGEFPIAALSVETIRDTWGPGAYRVQFIGERRGQRKPLGSRVVNIRPAEAPPVEVVDRAPAPSPDPLERAFLIFDAIDRRAQVTAQRDRDFLSTVIGVRSEDSGLAAAVKELASAVQGMQAKIDALEAGSDDDDDGDDDDEPEAEANGGALFKAGEPIKDTIVAEALNELVGLAKGLAPAAQEFIAAKMQEAAAEVRAKSSTAHALNGAPTTTATEGASEATAG